MPDVKSPAISVRATPGTANVRGRLLASADSVVENSGGPFTLVVHAKLGQVSPSLGGVAHWEYMPRPVNGGHGNSTYSVATLEPVTAAEQRVIKVRGEQMATAKRWDCTGAVWFDIECELYVEDRGHLTRAMTFTARVALRVFLASASVACKSGSECHAIANRHHKPIPSLVERRVQRVERLRALIAEWRSKAPGATKDVLETAIREEAADSSEYAAVVRAYLAAELSWIVPAVAAAVAPEAAGIDGQVEV